jgi:hypothetical protein
MDSSKKNVKLVCEHCGKKDAYINKVAYFQPKKQLWCEDCVDEFKESERSVNLALETMIETLKSDIHIKEDTVH